MLNYETYELQKVKQEMDFVGEIVTEFKTLFKLYEEGLLPNGLNDLYMKGQLRDIKRSLVNAWLILNLNEYGEHYWNLNDNNKLKVENEELKARVKYLEQGIDEAIFDLANEDIEDTSVVDAIRVEKLVPLISNNIK